MPGGTVITSYSIHYTKLYDDRNILTRIFENLLSNAVRYSPLNNTIKISALADNKDSVKICVENQGSPIPEEALETIFNKYVQGSYNFV